MTPTPIGTKSDERNASGIQDRLCQCINLADGNELAGVADIANWLFEMKIDRVNWLIAEWSDLEKGGARLPLSTHLAPSFVKGGVAQILDSSGHRCIGNICQPAQFRSLIAREISGEVQQEFRQPPFSWVKFCQRISKTFNEGISIMTLHEPIDRCFGVLCQDALSCGLELWALAGTGIWQTQRFAEQHPWCRHKIDLRVHFCDRSGFCDEGRQLKIRVPFRAILICERILRFPASELDCPRSPR
jgi:hypothetical protein